jgi:RNA polymerase sigma-70 factor, ECF subfamily
MNNGITDDELMKQFSNCSLHAFNTLYERNKERLTNYLIRSFLINTDTAQDISQDALIKVYENKFNYKHDSHFCAWLFTIARNLAINEIKHNGKITDFTDYSFINIKNNNNNFEPASNVIVEIEMKVSVIKSEILKLKEKYRETLTLRYIDGMSLEDIQSITGKNMNTIKSILKRGLEKLKDNLKLLDFEEI